MNQENLVTLTTIDYQEIEKDYNNVVENYPVKDIQKRRIKSIKSVGKKPVYEITVDKAHSYLLANGVAKTNTGIMYSAQSVYILGRQQEKDGTEIVGYNFVVNIEKSREIKEKMKFSIQVLHGKGLNKWSGLMDLALLSGHCIKPKNGWYQRVFDGVPEDKSWRMTQTNSAEFWEPLIQENGEFDKWIQAHVQVAGNKLIADEVDLEDEALEIESDLYKDDDQILNDA